MSLVSKSFYLKGSILILLGIILGAFAAHALKEMISLEKITSFQTGVRYQVWGGIFMFLIGFLSAQIKGLQVAGNIIFAGVILFSLSIYFLNLRYLMGMDCDCLKPVGILTPIGGLLMIVGWSMIIGKLIQVKKN